MASNSRLRWVIGANYERTTVFENTQVRLWRRDLDTVVLGIVRSGYLSDSRMRKLRGLRQF